jgi:hypothetical protein
MNWQITQLDRKTSDGFVLVAHWQCVATEGEYSGRVYNTQSFEFNPDQPGFIPYDDLTEAEVIGWVKAALGEEGVAATEAAVAAQIETQKNPPISTGLPWSA